MRANKPIEFPAAFMRGQLAFRYDQKIYVAVDLVDIEDFSFDRCFIILFECAD